MIQNMFNCSNNWTLYLFRKLKPGLHGKACHASLISSKFGPYPSGRWMGLGRGAWVLHLHWLLLRLSQSHHCLLQRDPRILQYNLQWDCLGVLHYAGYYVRRRWVRIARSLDRHRQFFIARQILFKWHNTQYHNHAVAAVIRIIYLRSQGLCCVFQFNLLRKADSLSWF